MIDRDFDASAEVLRAIAHPVRLQILCAIKDEPHAVSEIEEMTGIAQPGLSQQLAILRKADLVSTRRDGKKIYYRVDSDQMLGASDLLDALAGSTDQRRRDRQTARKHSGGGAATFARILGRSGN
ncbi:Transcriptional regulator, ArsR family [Altererythrobacter epoxidivorans]|uniref:Transcriptional regulator, ArsR family n=1 Tax=Altererythrobacter epoxidivorans TaxID=361183 RepID=A0A0M4LTH9_9SPHN|nr:metalloregulator ArsR/SmtB family transcription factor [Altererythrobacter epoxidivorans]ALE16067.1 Transcriptional regulator, ArsR family [Altererythrobacter epoxidivorans]